MTIADSAQFLFCAWLTMISDLKLQSISISPQAFHLLTLCLPGHEVDEVKWYQCYLKCESVLLRVGQYWKKLWKLWKQIRCWSLGSHFVLDAFRWFTCQWCDCWVSKELIRIVILLQMWEVAEVIHISWFSSLFEWRGCLRHILIQIILNAGKKKVHGILSSQH